MSYKNNQGLGLISAGVAGILFGLGLAFSGMTNPEVVLGFLDLFGDWNPSLLLVMAAALAVTFTGYRVILNKDGPLIEEKFYLPTKKDIDWQLITGAVLFGAGWGLYGYCPGPAIASSFSLNMNVLTFLAAMAAGSYVAELVARR
jgi:uncharacterized membrane protein YedE/YeeE